MICESPHPGQLALTVAAAWARSVSATTFTRTPHRHCHVPTAVIMAGIVEPNREKSFGFCPMAIGTEILHSTISCLMRLLLKNFGRPLGEFSCLLASLHAPFQMSWLSICPAGLPPTKTHCAIS